MRNRPDGSCGVAWAVHNHRDTNQADGGSSDVPPIGSESVDEHSPGHGSSDEDVGAQGKDSAGDPPQARPALLWWLPVAARAVDSQATKAVLQAIAAVFGARQCCWCMARPAATNWSISRQTRATFAQGPKNLSTEPLQKRRRSGSRTSSDESTCYGIGGVDACPGHCLYGVGGRQVRLICDGWRAD